MCIRDSFRRWEFWSSRIQFLYASACQAKVTQSKHRVLPVPVGDSNKAFEDDFIAFKAEDM